MTCAEIDCGGTVVDGYCDVCGTAPATEAPQKGVLTSTAPMASTPRSRGSARTASSKTGSARGHLGAGVVVTAVVVFVQMDRDPIMSALSGTTAGRVTWDKDFILPLFLFVAGPIPGPPRGEYSGVVPERPKWASSSTPGHRTRRARPLHY